MPTSVYVDVIVPLPLPTLFTYSVPFGLPTSNPIGCRVKVPFGTSKAYTAIVARVHHDAPQEQFKVRPVMAWIDEQPMLLPRQMELWQWMAAYYLCTMGEVYVAALPAEIRTNGFRPKMECMVSVPDGQLAGGQWMGLADKLARAPKQQQLFIRFLEMSGIASGEAPRVVKRADLLGSSPAMAGALKALVDKGMLKCIFCKQDRLQVHDAKCAELSKLNALQQDALNSLEHLFREKKVCLLHGVTSSGKTEIYIHLISKAINEGKQALYLLPEIALTTQLTERLRRVFGNRLGVYHSRFTDAERAEIWQKQLSHEPYDVILGVRSSVFLPFRNLGLVVVDEEHENSYKQQDPAPRYHARDVAIVLARQFGANTLLGTATPSVESHYQAMQGKFGLVKLSARFQSVELPRITLVDTAELRRKRLMRDPFSPLLLDKVRAALAAGEQAILFQNRRGYAPQIECRTCGWVPRCKYCDVSLTYHRRLDMLVCHYCGNTYPVPRTCPSCEEENIRVVGYGTERIEHELRQYFPEASIARLDLDATRTRNAAGQIIKSFQDGKTDILIGTQMVSKGLDFDRVGVVGILSADAMLNVPDFRCYEHAFQLMVQVAGRAGRREKRGEVVLQTRTPDIPLLDQVVRSDYGQMYADQLLERRQFVYPPFCRLVAVYFKCNDERLLDHAANCMAEWARAQLGSRLLGPDKPAVARVQGLYIRKLMVKVDLAMSPSKVKGFLVGLRSQLLSEKMFRQVTVYFDVDPQ